MDWQNPQKEIYVYLRKMVMILFMRLNRVGVLIENPGVYPNMNAKENIKLKCLAKGISSKSFIIELLETSGCQLPTRKKSNTFLLE